MRCITFIWLTLLSLSSWFCHAQKRPNLPLIHTKSDSYSNFEHKITGWIYSTDGQWINAQNIIPVMVNSRNTDAFKQKKNKWGIDNIYKMKIIPVSYGKEKYYVLVKFYKQGSYKYEETQKSWRDRTIGYYYILD